MLLFIMLNMKKIMEKSFHNYLIRVISTWLWMFISPILILSIIFIILSLDIQSLYDIFIEDRYYMTYIEIISVGLLPLVISFLCKEDPSTYGITKKRARNSIIPSIVFVLVVHLYSFLTNGFISNLRPYNYDLKFPFNILYGVLGVFAYGPLEAFFVIWLIVNTDHLLQSEDTKISSGLLITVFIFGLYHIFTTYSIVNALNVTVIFFFLGLVYKFTGNSIGPMIAWTLLNGQVYFALMLLF